MAENRQILIASLPTAALEESNYELKSSPVPEPGPGEVLCRTLAVSIDGLAPDCRAARVTRGRRSPAL